MSRDSHVGTFKVDRRERIDTHLRTADTNRVTGETHKPPHPSGRTRPAGDGMSLDMLRTRFDKADVQKDGVEVVVQVDGVWRSIRSVEALDRTTIILVCDEET